MGLGSGGKIAIARATVRLGEPLSNHDITEGFEEGFEQKEAKETKKIRLAVQTGLESQRESRDSAGNGPAG